jgi:hypothetical protein
MKPREYLREIMRERAESVQLRSEDGRPDQTDKRAWNSTRELIPVLKVNYLGSAAIKVDQLLRLGLVELRNNFRGRKFYRLAPGVDSWDMAFIKQKAAQLEKVPSGWVSLSDLARELGKTVRCLQYFVDRHWLTYKTFKAPRPTRFYRRADFLKARSKKGP